MSSVFSIYVGKNSFIIDPNVSPLELSTRFCQQFHVDVAQQINVQKTLNQIVEANQTRKGIRYQNYLENSQIFPQNRKYILSDFISRNKSYEKGLQHQVKKGNSIDYIRFSQDLLESGNCTFKPIICKGNKKKNEENRFEILYNRGKNQMLRRNKSIEKPSKLDILDGNCTFKPSINNRSRILWDKSNQQTNSTTSLGQFISQLSKKNTTGRSKLEDLFDKLDSKKRGIISRDQIDLTELQQNDIQELMSIFIEIDEQNLSFNREQFIDYVQNTKLFTQ